MERIGIVGLDWRSGGAERLARMTVAREERGEFLSRLLEHTQAAEVFYLATCNRVEVGFVSDGITPLSEYRPRIFEVLAGRPPRPGEAERTLRAWGGEGAAEHMFLVASGLDSARIGEREIRGQVREARQLAQEVGTTGVRLDRLLEECLRVADKVHRQTALGSGRTSLAEIAIQHVSKRHQSTQGAVALVGLSPMTLRCGEELHKKGIPLVLVNRTASKAEEQALEWRAQVQGLGEFSSNPLPVEAMILATGAPHAVLDRAALERLAARAPSGHPPLVVDLAVPPDVDPEAAKAAGLTRIDMDQVLEEADANRDRKLEQIAPARIIIDRALDRMRQSLTERNLAPVLAAVQRRYRQTAQEGVDRILRQALSNLDEQQEEALRQWAETLARRFAELPSSGLRQIAHEMGWDGVKAFLARADARLTSELEREGVPVSNESRNGKDHS